MASRSEPPATAARRGCRLDVAPREHVAANGARRRRCTASRRALRHQASSPRTRARSRAPAPARQAAPSRLRRPVAAEAHAARDGVRAGRILAHRASTAHAGGGSSAASRATTASLTGVGMPWRAPSAAIDAVARVPLQPPPRQPVEQHRRAEVGRQRRRPAPIISSTVAGPSARALGAADGDALAREPARELELLRARGRPRRAGRPAPSARRRRSGTACATPRSEVGDDVDPGGAVEQRGERGARRLVRRRSAAPGRAGARGRARPPPTGTRRSRGAPSPARDGSTSSRCSTPFWSTATTCPPRPAPRATAGRRRLVRLGGEQDPGHRGGRGDRRHGLGEPVLAAVGQLDDRRRRGAAAAQRHLVPGPLGGRRERGADRAGSDDGDARHAAQYRARRDGRVDTNRGVVQQCRHMARVLVLLSAVCFGTTGTAQALGPDAAPADRRRRAHRHRRRAAAARRPRGSRRGRALAAAGARRDRRGDRRLPALVLRRRRPHRRRRRDGRRARLRARDRRHRRAARRRRAADRPLGGRHRARVRGRAAARARAAAALPSTRSASCWPWSPAPATRPTRCSPSALLRRGHAPERVMAASFSLGALLLVPVLVLGDVRWLRPATGSRWRSSSARSRPRSPTSSSPAACATSRRGRPRRSRSPSRSPRPASGSSPWASAPARWRRSAPRSCSPACSRSRCPARRRARPRLAGGGAA